MKTLLTSLLICACLVSGAQPKRKAKMAAVFVPGYYIGKKNDTVRCQVQINPEDPLDIYKQFSFISARIKKPKTILAGQTKGYGFEGRDFVSLDNEGTPLFAERLAYGRLRFYEYQFNGKLNGLPAVESLYFIKDAFAEGENADLRVAKKIPHKFYKKALRPYLQEQPMLWSDLDKYTFNRDKIVQTINEFNQYYASTGN